MTLNQSRFFSCIPCHISQHSPHHFSPKQNSPEMEIIALLNKKGGSGAAKTIFSILNSFSNVTPIDIFDFANQNPPETVLKVRKRLKKGSENARFIFCGGDGTILWGISLLTWLGIDAPFCIMPLGTANEISKCTGWGNSFSVSRNKERMSRRLEEIVKVVEKGIVFDFDVWRVESSFDNGVNGERVPKLMGAFMSVGIDAAIALRFAQERARRAQASSVLQNKIRYIKHGSNEIFFPSKNLNKLIDLYIDEEKIDLLALPKIRCLQFLNINSMSGGVNFFGTHKSRKVDVLKEGFYKVPKLNDGKIEVVAQKSIHSYNLIRVRMAKSIRIGQGEKVSLELRQECAVEIDGEPFMAPKGKINLILDGKRSVVMGNKPNNCTRRGIILRSK